MPSPLQHADKFVFLDKKTSNGPFGPVVTWTEGAEFDCLLMLNTSTEAIIAERQGVTSIFRGLVSKDIPIERTSVFKRLSDGDTFRVKSDPLDDSTPGIASEGMQLFAFTAEKWELPT